jgi:hypothetical protein
VAPMIVWRPFVCMLARTRSVAVSILSECVQPRWIPSGTPSLSSASTLRCATLRRI